MEFPLDMLTELHIDGVWTKVPTYERDAVEVDYGRPERGTTTDPGRLAITVNNRDGRFSPRNPMSPYYGMIGRNTRVRLSLPGEESYLELAADPGSGATTPSGPAVEIAGSIDVRVEVDLSAWVPGQTIDLCGKYNTSGPLRSWLMMIGPTGGIVFRTSADGTTILEWTSTQPAPRTRTVLRSTYDGATSTYTHYTGPSVDGPWTQLGDSTSGGSASPLFSTSAPLAIGDATEGLHSPPAGIRVYAFQLRTGIDGPVAADVDFTALPAGTESFTDSTALPWSLQGGAVVRDRRDLFVGEVSEWPQYWTPDGADAWVPLVASGVLRRMGQGKKALQSSLRRRVPSYGPMAYWPMEEGEHATKAYSTVPGIDPLSFSQANWAADSSLPSSAPLPTVGSQSGNLSHLSGMVRNYSWDSLPVWSVIWMYHLPQAPAARQTVLLIRSTGTVRDWYIQFGPDDSRILGLGREGETLVDRTILTGTRIFGKWVKARFTMQQESGGNARFILVWQDIDGEAMNYSNTLPGVTGRPTGVASPPGGYSANLQGMGIGHISAWDEYDPVAYDNAMNGWAGEDAWERMQRLSQEEGLALTSIPGTTVPELVGPQTTETLLTLLQEAADADGGLLLEDRSRIGLVYRERSSMYSQTPRLVLSYDQAPGLGKPLEPIDDDTAIRNDRTVQRKGGGQGRAVLEEGPLSVQDPPDGIGRYDDSITLSLYSDDQTAPIAYWRLALGTVDGPRYPTVRVLLHKAPHLIPDVLALTEGDLVRITGLPAFVGFGDADLIVDSVHHEMRLMQWTVTLNCQPAEPWQAGVTDDAVLGRVDTDGSELAAAVDADDTQLSVAVTAGPLWTSSLREYPFDLRVGGEVLTVLSPGTLVNANGNPFFDTNIDGWSSEGATLSWSDTVVHPDPHARGSLLITPDGGSFAGAVDALSGAGSVTAGTSYDMSAWVYSPNGWSDIRPSIYWYTDSGTFLTTSAGSALSAPAGQWTFLQGTYTAPASAGQARARIRHGNTPATTDVLYVWAARLTPAGAASSSPQTFTVARSVNGVVKAHTVGADVRLATPTRLAL